MIKYKTLPKGYFEEMDLHIVEMQVWTNEGNIFDT